MPLHSAVDGVLAQLRANLILAENLTRGLSRTQFNWRAEPGRWSIAQCIGHLNLIDGADLPRLAKVVESARSQGVNAAGPFHYGWLSRRFVSLMEPPITKKFSSPKPYLPPPEAELDATVSKYRRISEGLIRISENARTLDLSRVKTGLSGVPLIKMPLGARLSLLVTHDSRHLWQAGQVKQDPRFPT